MWLFEIDILNIFFCAMNYDVHVMKINTMGEFVIILKSGAKSVLFIFLSINHYRFPGRKFTIIIILV
jgi:hypothetical protein